ncbi:hypothetical protein Nepgr_032993 [Nepenthes gracilis]|uniref:Uncharacterized protein n=1 Tax=Nepenthes gracilis TaxID=150966 RepID=A0AAD3TKE6_NEPGR|nr:hypothetical protein Nepgr_032993 [Nepenthes gracilis]
MGACVSTPKSCVGNPSKISKKKSMKRRKTIKRRVSSRLSDRSFEVNKFDRSAVSDQRSFVNPTFQGSIEEAWFDSIAIFESECDDDFHSVHEDMSSVNGFEHASVSSHSSLKDDCNFHVTCTSFAEKHNNVGEASGRNSACNSISDVARNSTEVKHPVFLDEISSSVDENASKEDGILDNCGIIPNNCLPCLASTVHSVEKRRSLVSSPPSARKKMPLKLSFKWKEGHANSALLSSKSLLHRPIAGSQVPYCPIEKKILNSWSPVEPETFKVRGHNYFQG